MTRQLAISPDVHARNITDWFILNTRLQRITGEGFHATTYDDFADLHKAFAEGRADLVFANAADTATLVRDWDFVPVAAPAAVANEAAVVVSEEGPLHTLSDFGDRLTVAATDTPDVERICRILLEPADLSEESIDLQYKPNPVLVAKAILNGTAEAGFLPREGFDEMSRVIRRQLRVVISSQIHVVHHSLLASPALADEVETLWRGLEAMNHNPEDQELLAALGAPRGWERLSEENTEFMIDLMDALVQG